MASHTQCYVAVAYIYILHILALETLAPIMSPNCAK